MTTQLNLILQRENSIQGSTFGLLTCGSTFHCFTLEDQIRDLSKEKKIPKETAIPAGTYEIILNHSQRYNKQMPLLLNVPFFEGIRIHAGNTKTDTEGCILVGLDRDKNGILQSKLAFTTLFNILKDNFNKKNPIFINVKNPI